LNTIIFGFVVRDLCSQHICFFISYRIGDWYFQKFKVGTLYLYSLGCKMLILCIFMGVTWYSCAVYICCIKVSIHLFFGFPVSAWTGTSLFICLFWLALNMMNLDKFGKNCHGAWCSEGHYYLSITLYDILPNIYLMFLTYWGV
jgi:uncharacterized membrane protein YwzB